MHAFVDAQTLSELTEGLSHRISRYSGIVVHVPALWIDIILGKETNANITARRGCLLFLDSCLFYSSPLNSCSDLYFSSLFLRPGPLYSSLDILSSRRVLLHYISTE
ncbi:hypothetical protein NXS19_009802 [Fusarium pseudograminearum]|nr:hypothetical protein NXS19_009802 [Fusarium pseudograminearum]